MSSIAAPLLRLFSRYFLVKRKENSACDAENVDTHLQNAFASQQLMRFVTCGVWIAFECNFTAIFKFVAECVTGRAINRATVQ